MTENNIYGRLNSRSVFAAGKEHHEASSGRKAIGFASAAVPAPINSLNCGHYIKRNANQAGGERCAVTKLMVTHSRREIQHFSP